MLKKLLLISILSVNFSLFSQTLDPTFDTDGIVTGQFTNNPSQDRMIDAALQPDGKLLIAGFDNGFNFGAFYYIARLNGDGSIDTTFGGGVGTITANCGALKLLPDGKFISISTGLISKFNSNGARDTSFNSNGVQTLSVNSNQFYSRAVALQPDGKIVVVGYSSNGANNDFVIFRLNANGSFDTSFNGTGKVIHPIGTGADEAYDVAIQADGSIVVTGQSVNASTNYDFATIRLTPAGVLDNSFGTAGKVITDISGSDRGRALVIQADGKVLVTGRVEGAYLGVVRYNTNGTLDTTFNTTGKLSTTNLLTLSTTLTGAQFTKPIIKTLVNNKILISATAGNRYALIQLNTNGSFDSTFGTNGVASIAPDSANLSCYLFIKPDESILTGGGSYALADGTNLRSVLLKFSSAGSLQSLASNHIYDSYDNIRDMIEKADGKVIVRGEGKLVQYNLDGTVDTAFGTGGITSADVQALSPDLRVQADGKILCANDGTVVYRFLNNGQIDTTFGTSGAVDLAALTANQVGAIEDLYILNDGRIYVAFDYDNPSLSIGFNSIGLLRLNTNGTIDTSFGINGLATARFNYYNISFEYPRDIYIQSDGKIVLTSLFNIGDSSGNSTARGNVFGIARFTANGILDTTFGTSGFVISPAGLFQSVGIYGLQNDKFIVHAYNNLLNTTSSTLKYNANGSLDTTFGANGVSDDQFFYKSMILQPDGKILKRSVLNNQFYITRFNDNGSVDNSFGTSGSINTPINSFSGVNALLSLQNNKLMAGGFSFTGSRYVFALARYTNLSLGTLEFKNTVSSAMVYPNPIEQQATFDFDLKKNEIVSIEIVDIQGKLVQTITEKQELSAGNHKQNIDINNLNAGIYILQFSSPTGNQSVKIIKK